MTGIRVEQLTKEFPGGVHALDGIDLTLGPGERLTVVGPSGCGKTTLLRLIAGLERPSSGRILFNGQDVTDAPPRRRRVAFLFQRPALYPHLSVRDNLLFGRRLRQSWGDWLRRRPPADPSRVGEVVELLGLGELLARRPAALSGGQQQRVALGRALLADPAVLLLDEPLSNLDVGLRREIRGQLHLLRERFPATMIYVTHDPEEARLLGDRMALLDRGRILQVGTPAELSARPTSAGVQKLLGIEEYRG